MTNDLEMQLKSKYDDLASGKMSYSEFTTWFEQQKWPSSDQTDRMFEAVELTNAHIKGASDLPEDASRAQLAKIGDYLHGRTDTRPSDLGQTGMSRDALRHEYDDNKQDNHR